MTYSTRNCEHVWTQAQSILNIFNVIDNIRYMEPNSEPSYAEFLPMIKALADEMRLKIIDMLSCGQLCACDILESLTISQPTLSYHMRMLTSCGLVNAERRGTWMHYSLRPERFTDLQSFLSILCAEKENCICKNISRHRCDEECTNA